MQADDVDLAEQLVEVADPAGQSGVVAGVVHHLHPEAGGPAGDGLADAAEPDEPERRAVHVAAEVLQDPPALPPVVAEVGFGVVRES